MTVVSISLREGLEKTFRSNDQIVTGCISHLFVYLQIVAEVPPVLGAGTAVLW